MGGLKNRLFTGTYLAYQLVSTKKCLHFRPFDVLVYFEMSPVSVWFDRCNVAVFHRWPRLTRRRRRQRRRLRLGRRRRRNISSQESLMPARCYQVSLRDSRKRRPRRQMLLQRKRRTLRGGRSKRCVDGLKSVDVRALSFGRHLQDLSGGCGLRLKDIRNKIIIWEN